MSAGPTPPSGRPVPAGLIGWACVVVGVVYVALATESAQPSGIAFHRPFWLFLWFLGAGVLWLRHRSLSPAQALATCAIAAMLVTADGVITTVPLRDLELGLTVGERFLAGAPVYPAAVVPPIDPANFPFVYPPPALLAFGLLARLPEPVAVLLSSAW